MKAHLPSVHALGAADDRLLHEELHCLAVREQVAVVRALAEHIEYLDPRGANTNLRAQLVEELARLGCQALEAAASMSETIVPAPRSGVLPLLSDDPRVVIAGGLAAGDRPKVGRRGDLAGWGICRRTAALLP
jgi:hypothetical protein